MAWGWGGVGIKTWWDSPVFFSIVGCLLNMCGVPKILWLDLVIRRIRHYITNTMEDETAKTVQITLFWFWEKKDIQETEVNLEKQKKNIAREVCLGCQCFRNFIIKEGECYFTKRNVASHSMHHNESAECMSGEKKIYSLSSGNYLLRRILSLWASIKGCNSKFDKKGGNILHRGPQLLFLSYLLLLSSEILLYQHFPLSSLHY